MACKTNSEILKEIREKTGLKGEQLKQFREILKLRDNPEAIKAELKRRKDALYADPDSYTSDEGKKVLDAEHINSFEHIETLMDDISELDKIDINEKHRKHLSKVVNMLVGGLKEPVEEMNVYLNDKAKKNSGMIVFDGKDKGIHIDIGTNSAPLSVEEPAVVKFVHELLHGGLEVALTNNKHMLGKQISEINKIRAKFLDKITPEDLLGDNPLDRETELAMAEDKIDYMRYSADKNDDARAMKEFISIALTNEKSLAVLRSLDMKDVRGKESVVDKLIRIVREVFDSLRGVRAKNKNAEVAMMELVSQIAAVNKQIGTRKAKNRYIGKIVDTLEERFTKMLEDKEVQNTKKVVGGIANKWDDNKKLSVAEKMRVLWYVVGSKEGYPILENLLAALGMKEQGTLQTVLRHIRSSDDIHNKFQELTMASLDIDRQRELTAGNLSAVAREALGRKLKKHEREAIYVAMTVGDGFALLRKYNNKAKKLYSDDEYLSNEINKIEQEIDSMAQKGNANWYKEQARGLGRYMMTGESSVVQRRNAKAILGTDIGAYGGNRGKDAERIEELIDTLASLQALKLVAVKVKENMSKILDNDFDGMQKVAEMDMEYKKYIRSRKSLAEQYNMEKNYHRQTYDEYTQVKIAPLSDKSKMRHQGYKYVGKASKLRLGVDMGEAGVYVTKYAYKQPINKAAVRYGNDAPEGYSLYEDAVYRGVKDDVVDLVSRQVANGKNKAKVIEQKLRDGGKLNLDVNAGVIPILNEKGDIVDFRVTIPTSRKVKHMGIMKDAAEAIGRSWAHELDVEESKKLNDIVWDELITDMANHARPYSDIGLNEKGTKGFQRVQGVRYVELTVNSKEDDIADYARLLPRGMKEKLNKAKKAQKLANKLNETKGYTNDRQVQKNYKGEYEIADKVMEDIVGMELWNSLSESRQKAVRTMLGRGTLKIKRNLLLDALGVRDFSAAGSIANKKWALTIKQAVAAMEMVWKEIVKIYKVNVIIKTLPVPIGNVVSNGMYSLQYGLSMKDVAKVQLDGYRLLKEYTAYEDELVKLRAKVVGAKGRDKQKLENKIKVIESSMEASPIYPLMKAHLYQHIVEDTGLVDSKSSSRFTRYVDEKLEYAPEIINTAGNWMFVTEKTGLFKQLAAFTAASDFAARYAQYTLSMDKEKNRFIEKYGRPMTKSELKKTEKEMIIMVRDAYVNYSRPDSRLLQYLNDMGFVVFTKYAVRIQLGIRDLARGKPLRLLLALIGQELFEGATGINPEDIVEKSVFERPVEHWMYAPGMDEILGTVAVPHSVVWMTKGLL